MAKQTKILPTPNLIGKPVVNFTLEEHEAMVWNKGYNVTIESAIKCPCKTKDNDHLSTCENCLGVGWVFINSVQDRAVLSSINFETAYKEWSAEKLGTVNVTVMRRSYFSYMDKIIVQDSSVRQSEVLFPFAFNTNYFAYTIYDIDSVEEVFQFQSVIEPLLKLEETTDFTVDGNKILLVTTPVADIIALKALTGYINNQKSLLTAGILYQFNSISTTTPDDDLIILPDDIILPDPGRWLKLTNLTLSVRYYHKLQYYVLDIPHTIRNSYRKDSQGRDELQKLPVNAIARLSHYVIDSQNFAGDNIFDNSYQEI